MMERELERKNFLNWYCLCATTEEIEKAKRTSKKTLERLINELHERDKAKDQQIQKMQDQPIQIVAPKIPLISER